MSLKHSPSGIAARRGELLAELFLQEFNPLFISRPTQDLGYDLLVGFANDGAGVNTFAVAVRSTERPPGARVAMSRSAFHRIAHSNVPGLLLVADAKRSQLYYAWLRSSELSTGGNSVSIPLEEVDETARRELKRQFEKVDGGVAAAG